MTQTFASASDVGTRILFEVGRQIRADNITQRTWGLKARFRQFCSSGLDRWNKRKSLERWREELNLTSHGPKMRADETKINWNEGPYAWYQCYWTKLWSVLETIMWLIQPFIRMRNGNDTHNTQEGRSGHMASLINIINHMIKASKALDKKPSKGMPCGQLLRRKNGTLHFNQKPIRNWDTQKNLHYFSERCEKDTSRTQRKKIFATCEQKPG